MASHLITILCALCCLPATFPNRSSHPALKIINYELHNLVPPYTQIYATIQYWVNILLNVFVDKTAMLLKCGFLLPFSSCCTCKCGPPFSS